jgi:hypothetical protein|tara:strand:- start:18166 stop:18462 length:297 start_codon:yes stop_codon:yes gene_type:complete
MPGSSIRFNASAYGHSVGDQALTVSSTAVACTVPTGAIAAMVTNGGEAIRVRWGTPTASVGHYLNPYSVLDLYQDDLTDVKFIRVGSSDSDIQITYFG